MPSPTRSVPAAGSPKRTAWPWTRPSALRGRDATGALAGRSGSSQVRCTPADGAVTGAFPRIGAFPRTGAFHRVAGDGGDQRRQAANAAAVAIEERGVEAQRREAAAVDGARPEIRLGVCAVDGAATPPEAARRVGAVVVFGGAGGGLHRRRCEEGARLGEGDAERARAGGDADEIEEVAVRAIGARRSTCRERRGARGGRRASAPGRRGCRRRSSSARSCGRGGGSAGRPPRRARRGQ